MQQCDGMLPHGLVDLFVGPLLLFAQRWRFIQYVS